MTGGPDGLAALQRWMMDVIRTADGVVVGAAQVAAAGGPDIEEIILPSQGCSSVERLAVYGHAYFARLIECLEAEFPATRAAVGSEAFHAFARGYIERRPSTSPNLVDLGRDFPDDLAATRPPRHGTAPDWSDFVIELAQLERIYAEVFDGPGEEQLPLLSADFVLALAPDEVLQARLRTAPSLQLKRLQFPVQETISAVRKGEALTVPAPRETLLAVHRRDYVVRRSELTAPQYTLLHELQQRRPLIEAIERAASASEDAIDWPNALRSWFHSWSRDRLLVDVIR